MHQIVSRLGLRLNCEFLKDLIFTARRYAGAVHAVVVCPSVCLSVCLSVCSSNRCCIETTGQIELVLARRLPSTIPTLCYKEIGVSPKIKVLPSGTLVPNSGRRKFRHGKSIALSTKFVVVVDGRPCWRHLCDSRRVVAVYYKSVNCNPLTPLLRFVVDLLFNLFLQLTRFWLTARIRIKTAGVAFGRHRFVFLSCC